MNPFYDKSLGQPFVEPEPSTDGDKQTLPEGLREAIKIKIPIAEWAESLVFDNIGHEPESYPDCPHCGGSGHRDDVAAAAASSEYPMVSAGVMGIIIGSERQEFFVIGVPDSKVALAVTGTTSDEDKHDESMRDAERLAACWNYCRGISTEALQKAVADTAYSPAGNPPPHN